LANRRQKKQNGAPRSRNARRKDGSPTNGSDMTRREAADYIATLIEELKSIAQAAGLPLIAYLLAMAKEEAQLERAPRMKPGPLLFWLN
jgi:hypothetical protein